MVWKYLWLIPAQKQFYWKFTCYMKSFLLWSEFWIYRENVLPLFWVLEVKASQLLSFYPLWLMSHWFSTWEATLMIRPLCPAFRVYLIIELVAVRSVTLFKHFLDCFLSVFTWPEKFPQRNCTKRSGNSLWETGKLWRSLLCNILGTIFSFDSCVTTALLYDLYQIIMWTFLLMLSPLSAGLICRRGMSSNLSAVCFSSFKRASPLCGL